MKEMYAGESRKINVSGSGFAKFRGCSGAGRINPRYMIRLFDGIENYSSIQMNEELKTIYRMQQTTSRRKLS